MATFGEVLIRARRLFGTGQLEQAAALYRQLVEAVPEAADAWHEWGLVEMQADRPEAAARCIERAISLDAASAAYHSNLGAVYRKLERAEEALASFRRAVELARPTPQLLNNLALALRDAGREDEALAAYDECLKLRQDYANGHFNRANLLLSTGSVDEAIAGYRRAIELQPNDADAHHRLGVAYYDNLELDAAVASWGRALALRPQFPEARRNRALCRLRMGDFARGWEDWEFRLQCEGFEALASPRPRWHGTPEPGRTLLLRTEQGLGDTLHFFRYVDLVRPLAGTLKVEVQGPLVPLLSASGHGDCLVRQGEAAECDLYCPLMSVPFALGERGAAPYWNGPYLAADPQLVAAWESRLAALDGLRVGIAWAGNPEHPHDRYRSVRAADFAPLAGIPGVHLVSLQKGPGQEQIAELAAEGRVVDFGGELDQSSAPFMDTAAVIRNLDLVITVDTALGHLAGGMGAPVWLLLQYSPDWRWMLEAAGTPWYPSMRLFRQRQWHDWAGVFAGVAERLRPLAAKKDR